MITPVRQPCPDRGRGHIAMFLNYRHGKYLHGCVQVIHTIATGDTLVAGAKSEWFI